jgi:hypothetical protein
MTDKTLTTIRKFSSFLIILVLLGFKYLGQDRDEIKTRIDVEPNENQVDYSPADGSIVNVNPPPFTWLPVKKDITLPPGHVTYGGREFQKQIWVPVNDQYPYSLQISRDSTFRSDVITRRGLDISTHALDRTLEPGEWFWRYGVEDKETIYSKTRRFTVPSDVKEWPFPADFRQVMNSVPKNRPRLFILNDEIDSFRKRALGGDLMANMSTVRNEIESRIGEELPAEPKFTLGIGPEFGENSWRVIYDATIAPIDLAETFGFVYLLTGEKKYGEEARRRVLHFARWDPDGSTSDRVHNETNYRIVDQGSRAYDWTYELFTPDERKTVERSIRRRATQLYDRLKYRPDAEYHVYNRGSHEERITGFLAQAALCFAHEWEEAADWLKYALTIHWNLYPAWAKDDGAWHQGPSYWTGYQSRVLHFITALDKATGINLIQKNFFQNTPYYILYTNPPYARISPFGDGENSPPSAGRAAILYNYSSILNDPYLRWYADYMDAGHANNILGILLKNDNIKGKPPTDLPQSRYFPGVGLVSLHTDLGNGDEDIHLLFQSNPYGGVSHAHPNQNAFTLEAFGQALAIASGYYPWYGSDHHNNWTRQTRSSNSITIEGGQGQQRVAAAKGRIVSFENREAYDYTMGDATQAYMSLLDRFHRHVVHIHPGIFVIYDDLEAPEPVTFEWCIHALSEMRISESGRSFIISEGDARLKVRFIQSDRLNLDQFTGFPYPPESRGENSPVYKDQWHLIASTAAKSTKSKFISVLVPYKKEMERHITVNNLVEEINNISFELEVDGQNYFVSLEPEIRVKKKGR